MQARPSCPVDPLRFAIPPPRRQWLLCLSAQDRLSQCSPPTSAWLREFLLPCLAQTEHPLPLPPAQKKGDRPKIKPGQIKSKTGGIVTQRALFIYLATDNGYLQEDGTPTLPNLDKPYLKVPAQMPVNCIRKFLQMALPDLVSAS